MMYFFFISWIDEGLDERKSNFIIEENHTENSEQIEIENQKRMLLISVDEEKQKQENILAIESDVKNVERDMQDIQDLFRDLSKLVHVCISETNLMIMWNQKRFSLCVLLILLINLKYNSIIFNFYWDLNLKKLLLNVSVINILITLPIILIKNLLKANNNILLWKTINVNIRRERTKFKKIVKNSESNVSNSTQICTNHIFQFHFEIHLV